MIVFLFKLSHNFFWFGRIRLIECKSNKWIESDRFWEKNLGKLAQDFFIGDQKHFRHQMFSFFRCENDSFSVDDFLPEIRGEIVRQIFDVFAESPDMTQELVAGGVAIWNV